MGIFVAHELAQRRRHDLPGEPEFVLEPAALALPPAVRRQLVPVVVDFFLILTVHDEREGLAELELRAAVQRRELLALQLKAHDHDRAFWSRPRIAIAADTENLGILEDRRVELRRRFGVVVEPEERRDFLHV